MKLAQDREGVAQKTAMAVYDDNESNVCKNIGIPKNIDCIRSYIENKTR